MQYNEKRDVEVYVVSVKDLGTGNPRRRSGKLDPVFGSARVCQCKFYSTKKGEEDMDYYKIISLYEIYMSHRY